MHAANLDHEIEGLMSLLLLLLLGVPAATAITVAGLGPGRAPLIRWLSLAATLATLLIAATLTVAFVDTSNEDGGKSPEKAFAPATFRPAFVPGSDPNAPQATTWHLLSFGNLGAVQFYLGIDGLNVWLVLLTAVLMVPSVLISWSSIHERVHEYYAWLLLLATGMFGVFLAFDIILFYVFFELTLVPLFFCIGIWGGPQRRHAARKFFVYTFAGSVITFLGLLAVVVYCYLNPLGDGERRLTFSIPELVQHMNARLSLLSAGDPETFGPELASLRNFQVWVFLALMVGFAIKVPLVPAHTWLPLAHVEAPTAGSVLLAGVLLKIGAYGFLRLCLPLTPDACLSVGVPLIGTLAVIGIIYGAFCALAQDDVKRLVAYSSVSHLGFCMLGMFALNYEGLSGSLMQMINHGLSTGALFLIVGMLYERYHTRNMSEYSGLAAKLGLLAVCTVFISLTSVGLPLLNGFVGEALVFFGMFEVRPDLAVLGAAGIVLGAWYLLNMVKSVFFGPLHEPETHEPVRDMLPREWLALGPIMVLCLVLGVYPQPVLDTAERDLNVVARIQAAARTRADQQAARDDTEIARTSAKNLKTPSQRSQGADAAHAE
jgi:NADH-quinone oxidoreductase subunit M